MAWYTHVNVRTQQGCVHLVVQMVFTGHGFQMGGGNPVSPGLN